MSVLPIVQRELCVASRRSATYWGRFSAALVALMMTGWVLLTFPTMASAPQVGRNAFHTLSFVAWITVATGVLRLTSESISKERREGTLGFLFLTDLKAYDIVFGKLAVAGLGGFYQFLAAVPALAVPMLLGGVTAANFGSMVLALINALFFSAAVGIWASTVSRTEGQATSVASVALVGIVGGLPLLGLVCRAAGGSLVLSEWLFTASPAYACFQALTPVTLRSTSFWSSVAITQAVSWLLLGLACWVLPHVWKDRPAGVRRLRWRERWQLWWQGDRGQRRRFRKRLLDLNPIHWLTGRDVSARWYPWLFLVFVIAILAGSALKWPWPVLACPAVLGVTWVVNAMFKASVASQAARGFSTDRDQGALELLLSTPMTERELIHGQWLTLKRIFAAPTAVLLGMEAIWMTASMYAWEDSDSPVWVWVLLFAASLAFLIADLMALGWVALWNSVTARNAAQAASSAQARVLLLPWFFVLVTFTPLALLGRTNLWVAVMVTAWIVASAAVDFYFGRRARRKLLTELRMAAARRYSGEEEPHGVWIWLGRALGRWWRRSVATKATPRRAVPLH